MFNSKQSRAFSNPNQSRAVITVEPPHGWGGLKTCQSKIALQWLYYEDTKLGGNRIKHARNGGEQMIQIKRGKVKVDGYDPITKTVYEFHGCEFHGCKKCKQNNHHSKTSHHPDRTVEEMYQCTQRKTDLLRGAGYKVIDIWECNFKKELKQNKPLLDLVKNMSWIESLDPRNAFYGGRTGMAKCFHKAEEGEQILYEDFTSLYPTINKYGTYPIGHPQILVNPPDQDIHSYFGIAKVDVIAPENLLHPVLPVKLNGKLMFPLCKKCVEEQPDRPWHERTNLCPHGDNDRVMRGEWCTPELQKAVEKGYRILQIHEVWHFPEAQRKQGLFAPYVNTLLKYKTEASGWPSHCDTQEKKDQYVKDFEEKEGIKLDNMVRNPGRKQLSKLMLNS